MFLPDVADYSSSQYNKSKPDKSIVTFKGLNLLPVIGDGEFSTMTNLSARNYPCLSPRTQRSTAVSSVSDMTAFTVIGGVMVYIRSNALYYNGVSKGALSSTYASSTRQLIAFQDRVLIWPDKMYYDITNNALGYLENSESKTGLVFVASALDSSLGDAVKYASITASAVFSGFNEGDSIDISGCTVVPANNKAAVIDHISSDAKTIYFTENTFSDGTESGSVAVSRSVPNMDFICVANNRVWGVNGNTIYGSKLGSAENWNNFSGISTDSYTVDVATGGSFTGCHQYGSYVVFFKEDYIHKMIGTKPTNFQMSTVICPGLGLASGSVKSIAYISGILYFQSRLGIVSFSGGAPTIVSEKLGDIAYSGAVACTDGRNYYVSMTNGTAYAIYVFDTFYNLWHAEDAIQVKDFGVSAGTIYELASGSVFKRDDTTDNESVTWSGTLGEFTEFSAEKKIHSRIRMRVDLPEGSSLKVEYSADGGTYVTAWTGGGSARKGIYISIIPTRCDSFVVRLSGTGDCKIYQLDRVFSYSTDMR